MNFINNLPYDCQNRILDYLYELNHRKIFNSITKELESKAVKVMWKKFSGFETDDVTKNEAIFITSKLENCNCCERHKKNRPSLQNLLDGEYTPYGNIMSLMAGKSIDIINKNLCQCDCSCRHIIRSLCRTVNDPIDENLI